MNKKDLFNSIHKGVRKSGIQLAYMALLMYHTLSRKETPYWAKSIISGALVYLVCPADAVPDVTPILGYTDDLGVLSFGLVSVAAYVNKEVKENSRQKLSYFFKNYSEEDLEYIDKKL